MCERVIERLDLEFALQWLLEYFPPGEGSHLSYPSAKHLCDRAFVSLNFPYRKIQPRSAGPSLVENETSHIWRGYTLDQKEYKV